MDDSIDEEVISGGSTITVEFSGGAETLFGGVKEHIVPLDGSKIVLLEEMLRWLRDNLLTGDANLFLQDQTVRPGILVMINDTDWDLMGETEYILQPGDHILFISTLHGG